MKAYTGVEKRRSPRVRDGIRVRLAGEKVKRFGTVLNTSIHGMLVRTKKYFNSEEEISMLLYLPCQEHPVYVRGRVVRTVTKISLWGFRFVEEIGIEFLEMSKTHKDMLKEATNYLARRTKLRDAF